MEIKCQRIEGNRPSDIPEGWIIFNAHRQIYGEKTWSGDFLNGRFYSAADPSNSMFLKVLNGNKKNDAVVCEYVSFADMEAWARMYAESEGFPFSELDSDDIRRLYFHECGEVVKDI